MADFGVLGEGVSNVAGTGGLVANCVGGTKFAGGAGTHQAFVGSAGGGGGAGSAGAGGTATDTAGGAAGTPDGGVGGGPQANGTRPGGGGGSSNSGTIASGAGAAGQIAYTFYISTATFVPNGGDIAKLAAPRRLDELAVAPIGVPKGEFLPNFLSQWLGQSDIARLPPIRPVDDVRNPPALIVVAVIPNYVSQWLGQSDILRLPPIKPLDDVRNPPAVAKGEFLASFVSQWLGQTDIARLNPPRPLDNLEGPVGVAKGEFLSSFVSQWLGQSDPPKLPPPRGLDNPAAPLGYLGEFIPSLVSQWLGQSDVARLAPPRSLDNPAAPLGYKGEFTPSFVSQWLGQSDVIRLAAPRPFDNALSLQSILPPTPTPSIFWLDESGMARWTLLRAPRLWEDSSALVIPVIPVPPPPPPIVAPRCVWALDANFTATGSLRVAGKDQIRYAKIGDTLTWSASFYLGQLIVLTPLVATVTIAYQTRSGAATVMLTMAPTGFIRTAQWTVPIDATEVSTAKWTIAQNDLAVSISGHLQIFGRFARPVRSV